MFFFSLPKCQAAEEMTSNLHLPILNPNLLAWRISRLKWGLGSSSTMGRQQLGRWASATVAKLLQG